MTLDDATQFISRVLEPDDIEGMVSLYVSGSVAQGRAHEDSDLDIGVLLDRRTYADEGSRFHKRLLLSATLSRVGGPDADVVILNDAPPLLGRRDSRAANGFCASTKSWTTRTSATSS